jgi:hypothetical protein
VRSSENVIDEYRDGYFISLLHIVGEGFCSESSLSLSDLPDPEGKPATPL